MLKPNNFEIFGTLEKEETLFTLNDKTIANTLVYEAIEPFPGYYHEIPDESMPVYVYLILDQNYTWEKILRVAQRVAEEIEVDFEAAKCYLTIGKDHYAGVRLRHLANYDDIAKIQQAFIDSEIFMLEERPKASKSTAVIKLIKFFVLNEFDNHMYMDGSEEFHGYFEIPETLKWYEFEKLTQNVRYNWDYSQFDAAIGTIYYQSRLRDVIRIYSPKISESYLKDLRDVYLNRLRY